VNTGIRNARIFRRLIAIALAIGIAPLRALADLEAPACSCDDIAQIQYRISEDQAAVDAYQKYQADQTTGLTLNTGDSYQKLQKFVQAALDEFASQSKLKPAMEGGEQAHTGFIDGKCQTVPIPHKIEPTPCMKAAVDLHEAVHRRMCEEQLFGRHLTLRAKIQEEIDAYSAEATFLEQERERLLCNCDYYALKFERHDTLDHATPADHQTQDWLLHDAKDQPFVLILLQLYEGKVTGSESASVKVVMNDTSKVTPCFVTSEPSPGQTVTTGEIAESFKVTGMMSHEFDPTLQTDSGNLIGQVDCSNTHGARKTAVDQPVAATGDLDLHFSKLDDDIDQTMTIGPSEQSHFKVTLVLNDRWTDVKAKNGLGSSVEEALRVIGLADCESK
jgi:hypothetical protein